MSQTAPHETSRTSRIDVLRVVHAGSLVLLAFALVRTLPAAYAWARGRAPSYPGQYASRLAFALTMIPLCLVILLNDGRLASTSRRILVGALLAVTVCGVWLSFRLP